MALVAASRKNLEFSGVAELQDNIQEVLDSMGSDLKLTAGKRRAITHRAFAMLNDTLRDAATIIKNKTIANATALRWPREAIAGVFAYYDPTKERRRTTALAGISKRTSMVEWYPGTSSHPRAKREKGYMFDSGWGKELGVISMALATMFEYGTTRMDARPALKPAITTMRAAVLARLAAGYKQVIESFNWGH